MRFYCLGFWGVVHFQRKPSSCVGYNKSTYVESTLLIMFVPYFSRLIFPMHKFSLLNFATFLLVHSPYFFSPPRKEPCRTLPIWRTTCSCWTS
jgi:hypothetical protein